MQPHELYQLVFRPFLNNRQYERTLHLQLADTEIVGEEDVIKWLTMDRQNDNNTYEIILSQVYEYKDMIFNDSKVTAVIQIIKDKVTLTSNQIKIYNWRDLNERVVYSSNNREFDNYVKLAFHLSSPNLQHYIGIDIVRNNDGMPLNGDGYRAYEYFTKMRELSEIRVSHLDNFLKITNGCIATIKYDGIHHIVSLVEGERYAYVKADFIDKGFIIDIGVNSPVSAYLSTELMNGMFYILDIYAYGDNKYVYTEIYTKRLDRVSKLNLPTTLFTPTTFYTGEIMTGARSNFLEALFQNYPSVNDLDKVKNKVIMPQVVNFWDYRHEASNLGNSESEEVKKYYATMKNFMNPSSHGMQLAAKYNISSIWVYILSPAMIESLILAFFEFGCMPKYWENIKSYVSKITGYSDLEKLNSLRYKLINAWTDVEHDKYPSDGIVFYRNGPILKIDTYSQILKWKPKNRLTVDVIIEYDSTKNDNVESIVPCTLYCSKFNKHSNTREINKFDKTFKIKLDNFSKTRPKCNNGNIVISNKSIVEVLFDNDLVIPDRIRYDKSSPNGYNLLESVLNNTRPTQL